MWSLVTLNKKHRLEINPVGVFLYAYYTILYGARCGASNYFAVFKHTYINALFKMVHGTLAPFEQVYMW